MTVRRARVAGLLLGIALLAACGAVKNKPSVQSVARAIYARPCFSKSWRFRKTEASPSPCRSPDGAWAVRLDHDRLTVTRTATRRPIVPDRALADVTGDQVTWVAPHSLFFSINYRVFRFDPSTRKVRFIAEFSDFVVSLNGRRLAGFADLANVFNTVGVITLATGRCVRVPPKTDESDEIGDYFPNSGFTRTGGVVVAARDLSARVTLRTYPISSLRRPCPPSFTKKP